MPSLDSDRRFVAALGLIDARDFEAASDLLEELFFEAVMDEVPVVRALMQLSVGCLHAERRQQQAAAGRLVEAVKAIDQVTTGYGIDFVALRRDALELLAEVRSGVPQRWPVVRRQAR